MKCRLCGKPVIGRRFVATARGLECEDCFKLPLEMVKTGRAWGNALKRKKEKSDD